MASNNELFIRGLTEDPVERDALTILLRTLKNKVKVRMTAVKLPRHNREAMRMTVELLKRPGLIKSFNVIIMKKLRYQTPEEYSEWIQDMTDHLDYVLTLRARFKPQQTYNAIGDYFAGLGKFDVHPNLTSAQKSCILAANYVTISSPGLKEHDFIYDWEKHYVRLADSDLIDFIHGNPEDAARIQTLITDHLLLRPAELDAALTDGTAALLSGSL